MASVFGAARNRIGCLYTEDGNRKTFHQTESDKNVNGFANTGAMKFIPAIVIHGGAGTLHKSLLTPEKEQAYHAALQEAVKAGYAELSKGKHALDAVTSAVVLLEDCPLFNAGRGSVFNHCGKHEMDASLMRGDSGMAGAVAAVRNIKNPILAARAVMEQTSHVLLAAEGAEEFARQAGLKFEPDNYFFDEYRYRQWMELKDTSQTALDHSEKKFGTVGAVAIDVDGNLAAATSTGGLTNKKFGRIGDTPLIGAGTYANNKTCAVSCTGDGEYFIRSLAAYDVSCLMEYRNLSIEEACRIVVQEKLKKTGGEGGLIAIDRHSNPVMEFNTSGMYRAWMKEGKCESLIYR
jgi:beta-aspartyl-peptidase (threonine type)